MFLLWPYGLSFTTARIRVLDLVARHPFYNRREWHDRFASEIRLLRCLIILQYHFQFPIRPYSAMLWLCKLVKLSCHVFASSGFCICVPRVAKTKASSMWDDVVKLLMP